jgi:hypothetical protein
VITESEVASDWQMTTGRQWSHLGHFCVHYRRLLNADVLFLVNWSAVSGIIHCFSTTIYRVFFGKHRVRLVFHPSETVFC